MTNKPEKIFVIVLTTGKRLEYSNNEWIQQIIGDKNGAPQYIKVTNRRNEALQNFINWDIVSHMWVNVNKRTLIPKKDIKSSNSNDVKGPEITTNTISNTVLDEIRKDLESEEVV